MTNGQSERANEVSLARNYRDGCVWIELPGKGKRECKPPVEARRMAAAIEAEFGDDEQAVEIAETLREFAGDVEQHADAEGADEQ